jgi:hypothetical protein
MVHVIDTTISHDCCATVRAAGHQLQIQSLMLCKILKLYEALKVVPDRKPRAEGHDQTVHLLRFFFFFPLRVLRGNGAMVALPSRGQCGTVLVHGGWASDFVVPAPESPFSVLVVGTGAFGTDRMGCHGRGTDGSLGVQFVLGHFQSFFRA